MAVPSLPFLLTQANLEFLGSTAGLASATLIKADLPPPELVSKLAGKSAGNNFTVGHAYDFGDYYGWMTSFFTAGGMNPLTIPGVGLPMKDFFATNVGGYEGSVTFASDPGVHIHATFPDGMVYRFHYYTGITCALQNDKQAFYNYIAARNGQSFKVKFTAVARV